MNLFLNGQEQNKKLDMDMLGLKMPGGLNLVVLEVNRLGYEMVHHGRKLCLRSVLKVIIIYIFLTLQSFKYFFIKARC